MADPIRTQILAAYVGVLEGITVGNGYRNTITAVEVLAKDWSSHDLSHDVLPWAGVVPGDDVGQYQPFAHRRVDWPVLIVVHFKLQTRTAQGLLEECETIRTDLNRALHVEPQLDVQGVHYVHVNGVQTSEASPAAIEHGLAGVQMKTTVRFTESVSAA